MLFLAGTSLLYSWHYLGSVSILHWVLSAYSCVACLFFAPMVTVVLGDIALGFGTCRNSCLYQLGLEFVVSTETHPCGAINVGNYIIFCKCLFVENLTSV